MSLLTRRSLLNPKKGLPSAYQAVEYLWSQNTEPWLDTGYAVTTPAFKIEFKFMRTGATNTSTWGVDFTSSPREMHGHFYINNCYFGNGKTDTKYDMPAQKIIEGSVQFSDIYLDSSGAQTQEVVCQLNDYRKVFTNTGANIFEGCQYNDYLFGVNNSRDGIVCAHRTAEKIYYFRYYDNKGKLVRNFVPCYRKADNKPGMYETVRGTFHVNQGTGEFAVGLDILI